MTAAPQRLEADPVRAGHKDLVRLVIIGSVDDGKSTLIGRLLYETSALYEDQIEQVRRATRNGDPIDFSLFTDGLLAEREQGITIDVAYRTFETPRRRYILADTPGHAQYTRNMATGASTADAAIILVDAHLGVQQQTRRHAAIAALLGIPRLLVAINKMDLVGFDQGVFGSIARELEERFSRLAFRQVSFFPVSARNGDNVAQPSPRTPWHRGGTVLEFLESLELAHAGLLDPFRFPVQAVLRHGLSDRGLAGQIASGAVAVGEEVVVLPSGVRSRIRAIDTFEGPLSSAFAPMSVALRLADEVDVGRGDLLAHPWAPPSVAAELEANAVWLAARPLDPSRAYLLKHTTRTVPARVEAVRFRIDLETLAEAQAAELGPNDIGRIAVRCARPIACDPYAANRVTGAFILIDALTNETAAAGTIAGPGERERGRAVGTSRAGEEKFAGEVRRALGYNPRQPMKTRDLHVESNRPLLPPSILLEELPLGEAGSQVVADARGEIIHVLGGDDDRLLVVVGPCSVHDPGAALEYAGRLKECASRLAADLLVVMRVYFEKPRTTVGWKGLINDPRLDGSFKVNEGLRLARRLLLDLVDLGMPSGCEFLDPITPQFISDLVAWGAIGARTTESQVHRELASGLSMPVGFKNGTDGGIQIAIDAVRAASRPHRFIGVTEQGLAGIVATRGNPDCHIILRGGASGPNYDRASVQKALLALRGAGVAPRLLIDASHGNSGKDFLRQPAVAREIAAQVAQGESGIAGVMLESFLVDGRQELQDPQRLTYGQSITDACLGWERTVPVLEELAASVRARRGSRIAESPIDLRS
jgi:phospho-2-dehydro-3-deoxyheptonate aldolase